MNTRTLKIDQHVAGRWIARKFFPGLRIRGQWFGAAGFQPGARAKITVMGPGKLLVELAQ